MDTAFNDVYGRPCELVLPEEGMGTTFYYPSESMKSESDVFAHIVDWEAVDLIPEKLRVVIPTRVLPIRVAGDGNCLLRAVSFSLWGVENYYQVLRDCLVHELQTNFDWYIKVTEKTSTEESEWKDYLITAKQEGAYLGAPHIFALANVIGRVIVLYASDFYMSAFGQTEDGVAGTFIPSRIPKENWIDKPIIPITWSNERHNHFIPLIGVEDMEITWPIVDIAFNQNDIISKKEISSIFNCNTKIAPLHVKKLKSGQASVNHLSEQLSPLSQFGKGSNEKLHIVKIGNQLKIMTESDLERLQNQRKANLPSTMVYLNGKYIKYTVDPDDYGTSCVEFMNQYNIHDAYKERFLKFTQETFITNNSILGELIRKHRNETSDISKEDFFVLRRERYNHFPTKLFKVYLQYSIKLFDKIKKDFKLSSKDNQTLEKMLKLIKEYSEISKTDPKQFSKSIDTDIIELLVRLLHSPSKIVFPIIDLARLIIALPTAADYFSNHMISINDPHNILAIIINHMKNGLSKAIISTSLRFILNLFVSDTLHPIIINYSRVILNSIDKCVLDFPTENTYSLYGKILSYLSKLYSENENITMVMKLELVFVCVKVLSIYSIAGSKNLKNIDSTIITLNFDILQSIATLLYFDGFLQKKLLTINIRWPIIDIINTTKKLSDDNESITSLKEIAEDLSELLEKPSIVKNNIKTYLELANLKVARR